MDNKQNNYISVSYQLYSIDKDGSKNLVEQTEQGRPFTFIRDRKSTRLNSSHSH